ncbi:MAG: hypothetical protein E6J87_24825, partial [Deltaproteobacteria bacterium]
MKADRALASAAVGASGPKSGCPAPTERPWGRCRPLPCGLRDGPCTALSRKRRPGVMAGPRPADNSQERSRATPTPSPRGGGVGPAREPPGPRGPHMRRRHLALTAVIALACAAMFTGCNCGSKTVAPPLPPLSAVVLTPDLDTLAVGAQRQFVAVALDTDSVAVAGAAIDWTSGDPGVISVSSTGLVTAVGEGVTSLIASAGGRADTSLVAVFVQHGWYAQPSGTTNQLNGLFFQADGRSGWAVGDAGTIVHTGDAGTAWSAQTSATSFSLHGVWFTSDVTGFAVGNGGTVMRTRNAGASWTRLLNVNASENLHDVCFADSSHGWVVGTNGAIVRTADGGASWSKQNPTAAQLNSVSFSDTTNGWAVGEGGVIVGTHDGGRSWYVVQPGV